MPSDPSRKHGDRANALTKALTVCGLNVLSSFRMFHCGVGFCLFLESSLDRWVGLLCWPQNIMWSGALSFASSLSMFLPLVVRKCPKSHTLLMLHFRHFTTGLPWLGVGFVSSFFYIEHSHHEARTNLRSLTWRECRRGESVTPCFLHVAKGNDRFGAVWRMVQTLGHSSGMPSSQTCVEGRNVN